MKSLIAAAIVGLSILAPAAQAQSLDSMFGGELRPGQNLTYTHRVYTRDTTDKYFECGVPANSIGVVTLAKLSSGPSRHDIEIARSLESDNNGRIITSNILAKNHGSTTTPKVLVIPPYSEGLYRRVVVHPRDNHPAQYRLHCHYVDISKHLVTAGVKTLIVGLMSGSDLQSSDNIGRALNIGMALIERNNVLAIGLDVFQEELNIQIKKAFPDSPLAITFLSSLVFGVVQDIHKDAFYEMSPAVLRR